MQFEPLKRIQQKDGCLFLENLKKIEISLGVEQGLASAGSSVRFYLRDGGALKCDSNPWPIQ